MTRSLRRWAVALLLATALTGCGDDTAGSESVGETAGWTRLPASPLSPRHGAVGVWTGKELIVAGGDVSPACPPNADCIDAPEYVADGAGYDPATRTWRRIADAPRDFRGGNAVWTGSEMLVLGEPLYAYDPEADSWRRLAAPPRRGMQSGRPTRAGNLVVITPYSKGTRAEVTENVLDLETGSWTSFPHDPYGESYDRSIAWDGERWWLLSMAVGHHFEAVNGAPARLAVLEDGSWRTVERETPALGYGQLLWWAGDRLVITPSEHGVRDGHAYEPDSQTWQRIDVPEAGRPGQGGAAWPAAGVGPGWISGGGALLTALDGTRTVPIPAQPVAATPAVLVWAEDRLIAWGGVEAASNANSAAGWTWTPPTP